jgi:hypothetical protein
MLTAEERKHLEGVIAKMEQASHHFYGAACACGNHAFIEFTGLMNEYIKACEAAMEAGLDFTMLNKHNGEHLPFRPYFAKYLGEKLGCIYGPELSQAALAAAKDD